MKTRNKWMVVFMVICALIFVQQLEAQKKRGPGKRSSKPDWSPTAWQQTLPDIVVKKGNRIKEYSFRSLINADGYLCPGSAWCYQTLRTALPLLYKNSVPIKGDFTILYGPSPCAKRVYEYFMGWRYRSNTYLRRDKSLAGRQQAIIRKSTGMKVLITYDSPKAEGHTTQGAQAGDDALKASDKAGMKIEIISP